MTGRRSLTLCLNCLSPGASAVEVGPEKGSQRDPYRDALDLCDLCRDALLAGNFSLLAEQQADQRTIRASGEPKVTA